jgi:hypothetical protein
MIDNQQKEDPEAGSRMHVLDWVESPAFHSSLSGMIEPTGFTVPPDAAWQPKGRGNHRESVLTGSEDPFLTADQTAEIKRWWLVHSKGSKLPTWDLVVTCKDRKGTPGLILVEAKAHGSELSTAGKSIAKRNLADEQERSDANHQRIGEAISEASAALLEAVPGIALSRDSNYQFSNRIAFAWKLGTMGIPVVLIYLGFLNDTIINPLTFLRSLKNWKQYFDTHTGTHFPGTHVEQEIATANAPFWLLVRSLEAIRQSPTVTERKQMP